MLDCLAQEVLLSTLLYAGMSDVRHTVHTSGLYPGEGDRPNVPIVESSNSFVLCTLEHKRKMRLHCHIVHKGNVYF